ncbi:MAG: dephospho-CoA kinase [Ignavibacteriales bacterium]|nr:dephospho-CoA kinase [Ignavibacteriales bacterium]
MSRRHTIRIGVTGGIGSGKSVVCRMFDQLGVPVIYADDLARKLSQTDPVLRKRIAKLLGSEAYLPDGSFNRPYVASRIFSDKARQAGLNAIVHPAVRREINRKTASLAAAGHRVIIIEAALIYESGLDKELEAVLVVDAEESVRLRRVTERDGVSEEEVKRRMNAQWPAGRKLLRADYVLFNNGSLADLEEKIRFLHSVFRQFSEG